ncbi:hypothetical protein HanRHA438_Chr12g0569791 [Helianthus annuus]|nr:hypothetical protein HanRHA438_Chr12g0569791 [Helianthus annuus]
MIPVYETLIAETIPYRLIQNPSNEKLKLILYTLWNQDLHLEGLKTLNFAM